MQFIYTFSNESKEALLSLGFTLFQTDDVHKIFVFLFDPNLPLEDADAEYVISDSLTL